jgi:hypothetical protein
VNLVVVCHKEKQPPQYARFKITMNWSQIVDLSLSDIPDTLPLIDELVDETTLPAATTRLDRNTTPVLDDTRTSPEATQKTL